MSELMELQTRLTTAPLFAPPTATSCATSTRSVPRPRAQAAPGLRRSEEDRARDDSAADQAGAFAAGAGVRVASMIDPAQVFLGRVESATR